MRVEHRLLVLDTDHLIRDGPAHILILVRAVGYLHHATADEVEVLLVAQDADELHLVSKPRLHDGRHLDAGSRIEGAEEIGGFGMRAQIAHGLLRQTGADLVAGEVDRCGHRAAGASLHLGRETDLERGDGGKFLVRKEGKIRLAAGILDDPVGRQLAELSIVGADIERDAEFTGARRNYRVWRIDARRAGDDEDAGILRGLEAQLDGGGVDGDQRNDVGAAGDRIQDCRILSARIATASPPAEVMAATTSSASPALDR